MGTTHRSYLTAGVGLLGVGAIALAPVQPAPNHIALTQAPVISTLAVDLAASIDPITPWVDTFKTSAANIKTLAEFYKQKPLPLLQTLGANLKTYAESGDPKFIADSIKKNIVTFFEAPWSSGESAELPSPPLSAPTNLALGEYLSHTRPEEGNSPIDLNLAVLQAAVGQMLTAECEVDGKCLAEQAAPVLNFLNTPYSGQLIGLIGTLISPVVQLTKSFTAAGEYFKAGNVLAAINEIINIPANTTNAFLNGAGYLDLTSIITKILPLPVDSIGLNLGGLLTSTPLDGSLQDPKVAPTKWSGGAGLDGIAAKMGLEFGGIPLGWTGSVIGLGQFLSEKLLVTPPAPVAAVHAAASAPAAVEAAVAATPAAAAPEAPATVGAPVVVEAPTAVESPALKADSAPAAPKQSAAGDNAGSSRGSHTGARGSRTAK